jgi:hypothetical protein
LRPLREAAAGGGWKSSLGRVPPRTSGHLAHEHQLNSWTAAPADEFPRTGYAPSEYQTKPWPIEALIEGWFPLLREDTAASRSCRPPISARTSPRRVCRTICSAAPPHQNVVDDLRHEWERTPDARTKSGIARRALIVFLDIPFHRRDFKSILCGRSRADMSEYVNCSPPPCPLTPLRPACPPRLRRRYRTLGTRRPRAGPCSAGTQWPGQGEGFEHLGAS